MSDQQQNKTPELTDMAAGMRASLAPNLRELVDARLSRVSGLVNTQIMTICIREAEKAMLSETNLSTPPTEREIAAALEACRSSPEVHMIVRRLAFQRDLLLADRDKMSAALAGQHANVAGLLKWIEELKAPPVAEGS